MSNIRKLASQTVLYGFTYFAGRLLNFFLTPLYTRVFTQTADFGIVTNIYAYITFFNILYTYGMETAYFYFANREESKSDTAGTAATSLMLTSILFSLLLMIFAPQIAHLAGYESYKPLIYYAALILLFDTLTAIPFAMLRKRDQAQKFALLKLVNIGSNIGLNLLFLVVCPMLEHYSWFGNIFFFYNPAYGIAYVFLSNMLASLLTLILLQKELRQITWKIEPALWKDMLRYAWPILILGFAGMINETLDRIMLEFMLQRSPTHLSHAEALSQVGIYGACYKLSIFMTLAIQSFRYAAEPFFFARMQETGAKEVYARLLKYFSFATGLIFLGVMLFLPVLLHILGERYRSAAGVVPILLLANLFLGIFYYLSQWYKQTGKTIFGAYISIGGAALTILINLLFIPHFGYYASAWATLICYFGMCAASYLLGLRHYPVNYPLHAIGWYIASAVLLYGLNFSITAIAGWDFNAGSILLATVFLYIYVAIFYRAERNELPFKQIPLIGKYL